MFEVLAFVVAAMVQSVPAGETVGDTQTAVAQSTDAQVVTEAAVTPMFLAPTAPSDETQQATAATPSFLGSAPVQSPDSTASTTTTAFLGAASSEPTLQAEPQVASGRFTTAVEVKPILTMTKANWISVREFNGEDLLYVTHLWSWRCGLAEVRVGVNGATPQVWPLPECHLDQPAPNAILEQDGLPYRNFGLGQVALIEVQVTYDDLSTENVKFNRQGMPLQ